MADGYTTLGLTETTNLTPGWWSAVRRVGQVVDERISGENMKLEFEKNTNVMYATRHGLPLDGQLITSVTNSASSAVVSSTRYTFTAADVGKRFVLKTSIEEKDAIARGTILSVSAGAATLSSTISAASSTRVMYFGSDCTAALQAATDAANASDAALGATGTWTHEKSGVVVLPSGYFLIDQEIVVRPGVSYEGQGMFATEILWSSNTSMATLNRYAAFHGGQANGSTRIYKDIQFRSMTIDMSGAHTDAGYSYHAKCVEIIFGMRITSIGVFYKNSPATSFGLDYIAGCTFVNNRVENAGRLWAPGGGGASGTDFQTQDDQMFVTGNQLAADPGNRIIANNIFINCAVGAIRNTNNQITIQTSSDIIMGNLVMSDKSTGKGIEDNCNTGSTVIGNQCAHSGTDQTSEGPIGTEGQHIWAGIIIVGNNSGLVMGNTVTGGWYDGIRLNRFLREQPPGTPSLLLPTNSLVSGNICKGATRNGIRIEVDSPYEMVNIGVTNNTTCFNGRAGIAITTSGTAGSVRFLDMSGNRSYDNGQAAGAADVDKSGIYIKVPISGSKFNDNQLHDSGSAKQKYGVTIDTVAVTTSMMSLNHASLNTAAGLNLVGGGTIAGKGIGNLGIADF